MHNKTLRIGIRNYGESNTLSTALPSTGGGRSPHNILYNHNNELEIDLHLPFTAPAAASYLDNLQTDLTDMHDTLLLARHRQTQSAARRRNTKISFTVGDQVMFRTRKRDTTKVSKKLHTLWQGPYTVLEVDTHTGNCTLDLPASSRMYRVFASDKLKRYHPPASPSPPVMSPPKISSKTKTTPLTKSITLWIIDDSPIPTEIPSNNSSSTGKVIPTMKTVGNLWKTSTAPPNSRTSSSVTLLPPCRQTSILNEPYPSSALWCPQHPMERTTPIRTV